MVVDIIRMVNIIYLTTVKVNCFYVCCQYIIGQRTYRSKNNANMTAILCLHIKNKTKNKTNTHTHFCVNTLNVSIAC